MDYISYFKKQAKHFYKDFQTQQREPSEGYDGITSYSPKFFEDIDDIIINYDIDEDDFSLMKAQHIIACIAGFKNWADLLHADDESLELGKLLLEHRNLIDEWDMDQWMYPDAIMKVGKLDFFKIMYADVLAN